MRGELADPSRDVGRGRGERCGSRPARSAGRASGRPRGSRPGRRCRARSAPRRRGRPAARGPTTRSTPSWSLTASILPSSSPKSACPAPSCAAYSPGLEPDVGGGARQPLAVLGAETGEDRDRSDLLGGDHAAEPISPRARDHRHSRYLRRGHRRPRPRLRPRSRSGRDRLERRAGAPELDRARPARRAARLPAPLGRRAPQHAGDRELGAGGADRAPRERDDDAPRRLRRRDAPEPPAARDRRAVRDARGAPPRAGSTSGSAGRPGTDRITAWALRRGLDESADDLPTQLAELRAFFAGTYPRITAVPGAGQRARDLAARLERLQRPARRRARAALLVRAPLHAAQHAAGARDLPPELQALGDARRAVRDDRRRRRVRRERRARPLAARLREALVPAPAHRPAEHASRRPRRRRPSSTRPTSSSSSRAGRRRTSSARPRPCATGCSSCSERRRPTS